MVVEAIAIEIYAILKQDGGSKQSDSTIHELFVTKIITSGPSIYVRPIIT